MWHPGGQGGRYHSAGKSNQHQRVCEEGNQNQSRQSQGCNSNSMPCTRISSKILNSAIRDALVGILGTSLTNTQWNQAKLPISSCGLGLRGAKDHASAAYSNSFLASRPLTRDMLYPAKPYSPCLCPPNTPLSQDGREDYYRRTKEHVTEGVTRLSD